MFVFPVDIANAGVIAPAEQLPAPRSLRTSSRAPNADRGHRLASPDREESATARGAPPQHGPARAMGGHGGAGMRRGGQRPVSTPATPSQRRAPRIGSSGEATWIGKPSRPEPSCLYPAGTSLRPTHGAARRDVRPTEAANGCDDDRDCHRAVGICKLLRW